MQTIVKGRVKKWFFPYWGGGGSKRDPSFFCSKFQKYEVYASNDLNHQESHYIGWSQIFSEFTHISLLRKTKNQTFTRKFCRPRPKIGLLRVNFCITFLKCHFIVKKCFKNIFLANLAEPGQSKKKKFTFSISRGRGQDPRWKKTIFFFLFFSTIL